MLGVVQPITSEKRKRSTSSPVGDDSGREKKSKLEKLGGTKTGK